MKKIILLSSLLIFAGLILACGDKAPTPEPEKKPEIKTEVKDAPEKPQAVSDAVIHFFGSPLCPSCVEAQSYFDSSAGRQRLLNARVIRYDIVNDRGEMDAAGKKNMGILVQKLEDIKKVKGDQPFIVRDRQLYEYYQKNGIPYHRREERYSRRDEPLPIPVFIVNESVYAGFNQHVISELARAVR